MMPLSGRKVWQIVFVDSCGSRYSKIASTHGSRKSSKGDASGRPSWPAASNLLKHYTVNNEPSMKRQYARQA